MIYVFYALFIAAIFGIIALCDFLLKKLLPKPKHAAKDNVVRMPRYCFIMGLILTMFAFFALLYVSPAEHRALWLSAWVVLAMGVFLLFYFFRFGIFYDDEGFTYRALTKKARSYRYEDIRAQQSFLARSGWNSTLYLTDGELPLSAAMQGVDKFLNKAFYRWCEQKGIDPDTVENNPSMLVFFPQPEEPEEP
ncbi:MAG: hypothetical protein J6J43_06620 [Oscillospiraceae bacterium]|nr:hypothetical protein [Oscillospiraceae bacterium]